MALIFGVDVSHHQGSTLDFSAFRQEGIEFAFLKATEGGSFQDSQFSGNLRRARAAGMLVAAYHYVKAGASVAAQVWNVARTVPIDVPVILDVESGSGGIALTRAIVDTLRVDGYTVPLLYLPRWYWQAIGSPPLEGLPPLWSSRYPDNIVGPMIEEYGDVPAHYWIGYGGLGVAVLQFTSSARVAGRAPLDANAFQGTREQLAALLSGRQEDDMSGEGPNILATVLTGGDSTRGVTVTLDGKVNYPTGVDPTSVFGRLVDIQIALTNTLPSILGKLDSLAADVAELKAGSSDVAE